MALVSVPVSSGPSWTVTATKDDITGITASLSITNTGTPPLQWAIIYKGVTFSGTLLSGVAAVGLPVMSVLDSDADLSYIGVTAG